MIRWSLLRSVFVVPLVRVLLAVTPDPVPPPIQAKLVHALQASSLKVGDSVFAKVQVKWDGFGCSLREGAILRGRVLAQLVRSKSSRSSEVALLFDGGECGGKEMTSLNLTLAALLARDPVRDPYEPLPLSSALGAIQHGAMDRDTFGHDRVTPGQIAATRVAAPMRNTGPPAVKPGQVAGISGVAIVVGGGPEGSSVITSTRHNLYLEPLTQIVLVANARAVVVPTASTTKAPEPAGPAPAPVDETEICSPPSCSIALSSDEVEIPARNSRRVPIKNLGFPALPTREMAAFDHEAALAFLGSHEILLTFNPHTLVSRPGLETEARTLRMIRGALIDLPILKVKKVVEWRVSDDAQYLWPISDHNVLIHTGRELKLYGPGLKVERSFALDGPLAFVQPSPSGNQIAVGTIQERHSRETHQQLRESERQEPEEDVKVQVLNQEFKTIIDVVRSSRARPPVLLEDGEVQVLHGGGARWRLVMTTWKGEQRVLAKMNSACLPAVSSLSPDLLFILGCDLQQFGRWYRVLGQDGKAVLKGKSSSEELGQSVAGSSAGTALAIGVARVSESREVTDVFHASDLKRQFVGVYAADSGRKLMGVNIDTPLPTLQTFALSPDASQLAVLEGNQIVLYDLPSVVRASH
jgi:hypothetical protein